MFFGLPYLLLPSLVSSNFWDIRLYQATTGNYVALIRLNGMIAPDRDFSAEQIVPILHDAFSDKNAVGVIIAINSPGGTPVQAAIIHDAIIAFKNKYKKKMIVVGEDFLLQALIMLPLLR